MGSGLGRVRGTVVLDDAASTPAEGQVLVWPGTSGPSPGEPFPRPLVAVTPARGVFSLELAPGPYVVRAATLAGGVCAEVPVEVIEGATFTVDFTCPSG